MTTHRISVLDDRKKILKNALLLGGTNPAGERLDFTNYYLERNGKPYIPITGEFHYSRYDRDRWEVEIIKMKMSGINVISTYVFWIHHEERRGLWNWSGNRDLREFIGLCGKHGLYAIVRIGPFNHGEVRNGGFPDWLYGMPLEIRRNDQEYLKLVRALYAQISAQLSGLLYRDGGPVIGTQIENEHNHSAATWGPTAGVNNAWLTAGADGEAHLLQLRDIAVQEGIVTPIYTCTGWGGATTPVPHMLPLWGGYAYWPWIYYEKDIDPSKPHPLTPEYVFRDKHNDAILSTYNFMPGYKPESYPYACCEMGGGMTPFYKHRFRFPHDSVPAMSIIKIAEGCNFLGYYMFHGGSNPKGTLNRYLNDAAVPKISYDFHAPIGEFGQIRESYSRTKLLHYFFASFQETFAPMKTSLPAGAESISPADMETLRFACRSAGGAGFLFINNFQDHADMPAKRDQRIIVETQDGDVSIPAEHGMTIEAGGFCMLPFNLRLESALLSYATAQIITFIEHEGRRYYFFAVPRGMAGEFRFDAATIATITPLSGGLRDADNMGIPGIGIERDERAAIVRVGAGNEAFLVTDRTGNETAVYVLDDSASLGFWKARIAGRDRIVLSNGAVLAWEDHVTVELTGEECLLYSVFPDYRPDLDLDSNADTVSEGAHTLPGFRQYRHVFPKAIINPGMKRLNPGKAILSFNADMFEGVEEILLRIEYDGDIGEAFIDGELMSDNFCSGEIWEIGLMAHREVLLRHGLYILITPKLHGSTVKSDTTMAGWSGTADRVEAEIKKIEPVPVYGCKIV